MNHVMHFLPFMVGDYPTLQLDGGFFYDCIVSIFSASISETSMSDSKSGVRSPTTLSHALALECNMSLGPGPLRNRCKVKTTIAVAFRNVASPMDRSLALVKSPTLVSVLHFEQTAG